MVRKSRLKKTDRTDCSPRHHRTGQKNANPTLDAERMASFPLLNPNPILEIDYQGRVTFLNKAAMKALKRHGAGADARVFLPTDIKDILKAARRKKALQLTRMIEFKNAVFEGYIFKVPEYNVLRFYLTDITDRQRSQIALRESEERFKSLFNELPLSTVVFQKAGRDFIIRDYNQASDAFTEHKMSRFVGRSARELYASRPEILKKIDLVLKKKTPQTLQTSYRMISTGRQIYLNLILAYVPPDRIIMHTEDISARKQADDKLRFQARILAAVKDAVIVSDPDFRITQWNRAAERLYGWRSGEVLGRAAKDVLRSEMSNREREKVYRRIRRGQAAVTELVQYTKDGRPLVIDGYTIPLKNLQGEITNYVAINHDITQRKRYEEELKKAKKDLEKRVRVRTSELERARSAMEAEKQRLYDVLETLPVYVVLLTKDYHVPFANKFFQDRFGESRGRRCYEYLFHRDSPCPVCESFKPFKTNQPHRWEWTGPDGRNYDIYDFPFKDTDGSRLVMEMGIDITEQKRAQDALKRANEYHRKLIEVSLDPLVTISAEGKITDVNEATIKATGRSRSELIGTDFSNYFTDPELARKGYQQVFARGFVADYPLTIRHRNGSLKHVLYNASVYRNEDGKVIGVFAAARDISVLKQAEEELKRHRDHLEELVQEGTRELLESQERLQRAEEIAQLGGWELNLADNRLTWSDEVYRIFGLKPGGFALTYQSFLELVHPEDRKSVDQAYTSSLAEGLGSYEIEHRVVRQDNGEIRWVHERCEHQRDDDGRVVRSVGMVHDITARKRTENDMRALNLRLEDINEQLKDFVFTVSHDLKAPLRAIQGYADALLEDYGGKLDAGGRVQMERIATSVQRLDTMIQDLLAYSRLSSEEVIVETVDLAKVVRATVDDLKLQTAAKNSKFTISDDLPPAGAHPTTLKQVMENLILNAITYVKPGVEPEVRIWSETHGEWVYLYFKDNGIGIAAEDQERIFKVFERLHGVESYPGTGVGLAIVKKGIERMGGKLGVVSTPGEGSTFWIALPRVDLAQDR